MSSHSSHQKITAAGLLVTLGIIYGDIGTSPLYVMKAIVGDKPIDDAVILGALSCIFWTITLQTTIKYVIITLRADNKGEGGIFSLYALVRRRKTPWLVFPALIGGSTLLADGIITPPISVASAVEGLEAINPDIPTIPIVIGIIAALFIIQRFGTNFIGKFFGPIMFTWFSMLGVLGILSIGKDLSVFRALSPVYGADLLINYPGGFWLLGAVFLCTTGAEALYSDLGHCGKKNVRATWGFVKGMLLLNYFGQGVYLMEHHGQALGGGNPFYLIMADWFLPIGIGIATSAAIIASQAMISGSFTLINEAIRLNFWPKVKVVYPSDLRGQLYIPSINWLLFCGCVAVVLYFQESSKMEAAYGLAIVTTFLMTTILLTNYLLLYKYPKIIAFTLLPLYLTIESCFMAANLAKVSHGGWVTFLIASVLITVMVVLYYSRKIRNRLVEFVKVEEYLPLLDKLSGDTAVPKYATHLVYLTSANYPTEIEEKVIYSILYKQPKRADMYWFVHVDVLDEPYTLEYKVTEVMPGKLMRVDFRIGFRIDPRINLMFRHVVEDLVRNQEVDIVSRYPSLSKRHLTGDFRFVVMEKFLSLDNELPWLQKIIMDLYFLIKRFALPEEKAFGLDTSSVTVEKVPLIVKPVSGLKLKRIS
ncbi:MAG: KUP/HAK/KT family potassium transporter [Bacteroidia bacterium]|nr:KUP/HAK/KT family potassium transporter [Bacteroidia bacterium]